MTKADVVIAGAGIIGLSCALELRKQGRSVAVLDRQTPMQGASWAAAGMLAAHDPESPPALLPLAERSLALYPEYLRCIEALSGFPVPLRTAETLQAISPEGPAPAVGHILSAQEAVARAPGLHVGRRRFVALAEASLDPRDLCLALPLAATSRNIQIHAHAEVTSITPAAGAVEVHTTAGRFSAGTFLNCCGAWSAQLMDPAPGQKPSRIIEPRKGQMALIQTSPDALPVVLRSSDVYLVPRGDGRVVVGASVERSGFDTAVQASTLRSLLAKAAALWSPAAEAPMLASWAGLRPGTEDGLPVIGPAGPPNCFVASGHFRNGILLAPATAEAVAWLILGDPPGLRIDVFAPNRFSRSAAHDNTFAAKL